MDHWCNSTRVYVLFSLDIFKSYSLGERVVNWNESNGLKELNELMWTVDIAQQK